LILYIPTKYWYQSQVTFFSMSEHIFPQLVPKKCHSVLLNRKQAKSLVQNIWLYSMNYFFLLMIKQYDCLTWENMTNQCCDENE
jgi:hypothetical protein